MHGCIKGPAVKAAVPVQFRDRAIGATAGNRTAAHKGDTMTQRFTSKGTSINDRLPAIIKLMDRADVTWDGARVLDYGCGQYPVHVADYAIGHGAIGIRSYDKYHHVDRIIGTADTMILSDIVILSNVLNVIDCAAVRAAVVRDCVDHMSREGVLYITVYDGDRSGIGKQTGPDAWQENRRTADYVDEIRAAVPGAHVDRHGKLITVHW